MMKKIYLKLFQEIHKHGGVSLEASKLGRNYKDIQREIIKADIVEKKNKY